MSAFEEPARPSVETAAGAMTTRVQADIDLPPELQRLVRRYHLQQKALLALGGVVLGFYGRGLMESRAAGSVEAPAVVATAPAVVAATGPGGAPAAQPASAQPAEPPALAPAEALKRLSERATVSVIGRKDAPITIHEFTDFQCPACQGAALQFLPMLKNQYVKTGRARVVLVHWPLPMHPNATPAARAALCVERLGGSDAFEKYHDVLFNRQSDWAGLDAQAVQARLAEYAAQIGVSKGSFLKCQASGDFTEGLRTNGQLAFELGAQGTPTFFVNGVRISSMAQMQQLLEAGSGTKGTTGATPAANPAANVAVAR